MRPEHVSHDQPAGSNAREAPHPSDPATRFFAATAAREAIKARYARLYTPLAIACLVPPFFPPYRGFRVLEGSNKEIPYGTVFDMAFGSRGHGPSGNVAPAWIVLSLVLLALLVAAALRRDSPALAVSRAAVASVIALFLVTRVDTQDPVPELTAAGMSWLVLMLWVAALGLLQATHLRIAGR